MNLSFLKTKQTFFILTIAILIITFFAYSNIFDNEFIGDDLDFISNWSTTHSFSGISKLISGDLPSAHVGTYRPIRSLFYLLTYQLWAGNVFFYHTFSLFTHLLITFLVILNIKTLTKNKWLGLSSGLLFGLHPIHTEAVTFITASFDTIAFVFLLSCFYFYQQFRQTQKPKQLWISLIFAGLSFFTNEQTLILPVIIVAYDYFFGKLDKKNKQQTFLFFILAGFFIFVRFGLLKITTRGDSQFPTLLSTILVSLKALLKYFQSLTFPNNLSISHTLWGNISTYTYPELNQKALLSQKITDTSIIISIVLTTLLVVLLRKLKNKYQSISFSLFWIFASFIPVLNLLPTSLIYAERYAYLPSFGFTLLSVTSFFYLTNKVKMPQNLKIILTLSLLSIVSSYYFYTTYKRNHDWQNEITFWNSAVEANQNNPTVYFQLGQVHHVRNHLEEARSAYQKTIEIEPKFTKAYYGLGLISESEENWANSASYYQQSLELDPSNRTTRQKLAKAYTKQADQAIMAGELSRASAIYAQAISVDPTYMEASSKFASLCSQFPAHCK